jgi:putative membrane protein
MPGILIRWLTLTLAVVLTAYVVDGIYISGFFSAVFAAAALAVLNAFFRPVVLLLTLPVNILTLGLFTFVINAVMLKMASGIITGFDVVGFWPAVWGSLLISVVSWLLNNFITDRGSVGRVHPGRNKPPEVIDLEKKDDDRWE